MHVVLPDQGHDVRPHLLHRGLQASQRHRSVHGHQVRVRDHAAVVGDLGDHLGGVQEEHHQVSAMAARLWRSLVVGVALGLVLVGSAAADEILLLNGDRLTGTIVSGAEGKLTIKTEAAGDVTVDLAKVKTFSTDQPIELRIGDASLRSRVVSGDDGTIQVVPIPGAAPQVLALKDLTQINPPPMKWTGALSFNGYVTTGNTETTNIGGSFRAVRRAEEDRITLAAAYNFGRQKDRDTG